VKKKKNWRGKKKIESGNGKKRRPGVVRRVDAHANPGGYRGGRHSRERSEVWRVKNEETTVSEEIFRGIRSLHEEERGEAPERGRRLRWGTPTSFKTVNREKKKKTPSCLGSKAYGGKVKKDAAAQTLGNDEKGGPATVSGCEGGDLAKGGKGGGFKVLLQQKKKSEGNTKTT